MKIKNKGKVHPSPSSSSASSSSSSSDGNVLSVLKLLPAAILALASVLSLEDREVLAYMITRSLDSPIVLGTKKRPSKKPFPHKSNIHSHKPPLFDCDCFDCYTSYWFRWDSSANRELIDQVIDAFEDHLANGETTKKNPARGKKKDRTTRPLVKVALQNATDWQENPESDENRGVAESQDNEAAPSILPGGADNAEVDAQPEIEKIEIEVAPAAETAKEEEDEEQEEEEVVAASLALPASAASEHRGLARKVLPDVLGLLNSRLWNLWSPNV